MGILGWTWLIVGASFALYIGIAFWAKAKSTGDFYVAEKSVHPVLNGMATGADWMSAASFISMAGLISFMGRDGSQYLMGWTGGYTLLAVLLAPYLRKYGKYTVPQFVGDRYYSQAARIIALTCAIFISFVYVAGQMRGVGIVFSRFLNVDINLGVVIGTIIVFFYATLGGMKGITYTQVAQYVVLIIAYMIPAIFISIMLTGNPIPQLGFGGTLSASGAQLVGAQEGQYLLDVLNQISTDLGFKAYTAGRGNNADTFAITFTMMVGTAGLPHIIIRFFTVPKIRDARSSAGWALVFIAILYTTAPAVATFARTNFIKTLHNTPYAEAPSWFKNWEKTKLVGWTDRNGDGIMQYSAKSDVNELKVDRDIIVLANPEIAGLPAWVVALVAAGGLAAALSTAAGLLLVASSAISHDLMKGVLKPDLSEKAELVWARVAAGFAVVGAALLGIYPPGFVAQVVAFAFGLAASSFFPVIIMGVFWKRATKEAAMAGMLVGIVFTAAYIIYFKFMVPPEQNSAAYWWFKISPEGIGMVGMLLNFAVMWVVTLLTKAPPQEVQALVASLRYPKEAGGANVPAAKAAH